jgi:hypothetical protein
MNNAKKRLFYLISDETANKLLGELHKEKSNKEIKEELLDSISDETAKKFLEELHKKKSNEEIKVGEIYWYINEDGWVRTLNYSNSRYDKTLILLNNFFRTGNEAWTYIDKLEALKKVHDYIKDTFGIFKPDWDNTNEIKYYIYYDRDEKKLDWDYTNYSQRNTLIGHFRKATEVAQLIENMRTKLETIFGV